MKLFIAFYLHLIIDIDNNINVITSTNVINIPEAQRVCVRHNCGKTVNYI